MQVETKLLQKTCSEGTASKPPLWLGSAATVLGCKPRPNQPELDGAPQSQLLPMYKISKQSHRLEQPELFLVETGFSGLIFTQTLKTSVKWQSFWEDPRRTSETDQSGPTAAGNSPLFPCMLGSGIVIGSSLWRRWECSRQKSRMDI